MIHSMTGYAALARNIGCGSLHLELRSVNSRYLDVAFRIVEELRAVEPLLRELIGARLRRGKVDCRLTLQQQPGEARAAALNENLLGQIHEWQAQVRRTFPEAAPLAVADLLRWPGMLGEASISPEELQAQCTALAHAALDDLVASRAREGEKLAAMIRDCVGRMRQQVSGLVPRLPELVADYEVRLATRLREAVANLDEERIRLEAGLFATRVDVAEELSRLQTHLVEVERVVKAGGTAGKRLDFLMQELNREANTLASKSVSADVTAVAVDLKLLVEQMREQVQNIE
ncbi:MAG: YicC family protein [Betaproteobacteria bacterium]|nr:YicC family protein [Betaproteobacteria bacterium]